MEPNLIAVQPEQAQKFEEKKDVLAKFLAYTGSSGKITGLKFYQFDEESFTHQKAIDFCDSKGLRLITRPEAYDLVQELNADKSKLTTWLGGKKSNSLWTSSLYSDFQDEAIGFYAYSDAYNHTLIGIYQRHSGFGVRCVGQ